MATNLDIDDKLVVKVQRLGRFRTKKDAVNAALEEFIDRREQLKILDSFGTVDFAPDYDHKAGRRKR